METANAKHDNRHGAIALAIDMEINRQARAGANRIDVDALAEAVEEAIDPPAQQSDFGKRPSEVNSSNDG